MKAKNNFERYDPEFHPTIRVWVEEESYTNVWGWYYKTDENGKPVRVYHGPRETVIPAHWRKVKNYDITWTEPGRFSLYFKYFYYRKIRTFAELRENEAYPEFVRGKRRRLPSDRDDIWPGKIKGWKDTHKCRKQWMKNL